MLKDQHHSDHILYHRAMQLEFSNKKNFPLPLTTGHSTMAAGTESKLRGAWSNLDTGGRLGEMMMLFNRAGEHVCFFIQDMKDHLIVIFSQHLQGMLSRVFFAASYSRVR